MLELKKISKKYTTGDFTQTALDKVSLKFRTNEFVAVLGPSGSGKTTLLNIIGGLDRYDNGDLIINGKSTKAFSDREWDAYRNNCVGFVFQSYNLIGHISVLGNVEMGMTLSGVGASERREKAYKALERVGLKEHAHKKPNQLSGGQMQRVAIARALVNDPDIILADEPTGALDTKTSKQIMELITEIAKDKLVIMVTHNPEIAENYATRIVDMRDGEVQNDSMPVEKDDESKGFNIRKTAMSFITALKLSFNNIRTKKGRTLLTAFAASIGIIGIALILSLSNGFDIQISEFERGSLANMPIMISEQAMQLDEETMNKLMNQDSKEDTYTDEKKAYPSESIADTVTHKNLLTKEYVDYIEGINPNLIMATNYMRLTNFNIISNTVDGYKPLGLSTTDYSLMELPAKSDGDKYELINYFYDVIEGKLPESKNELVLMLDNKNRINSATLKALGFDPKSEYVSFEDILGTELKLVNNDDYYTTAGTFYIPNTDYKSLYNDSNATTLKIVGIVRGKEEKNMEVGSDSALCYTKELTDYVLEQAKSSKIVKAQEKADYNVMTGEKFSDNDEGVTAKNNILAYIGGYDVPVMIRVYAKDFETKDDVIAYLDKYNEGKASEEQIVYTDYGELLSQMSGSIMDAITVVLIAFSAISLIVSTIMIAIITYISVLERTKEIGILRALGARKKDITRVFNAETFIIGMTSGLLGILITWLLLIPANAVLYNLTTLKNVAVLNPLHALTLIIVSVLLTLLGGFIPAKMASKKDPVEALRTE